MLTLIDPKERRPIQIGPSRLPIIIFLRLLGNARSPSCTKFPLAM